MATVGVLGYNANDSGDTLFQQPNLPNESTLTLVTPPAYSVTASHPLPTPVPGLTTLLLSSDSILNTTFSVLSANPNGGINRTPLFRLKSNGTATKTDLLRCTPPGSASASATSTGNGRRRSASVGKDELIGTHDRRLLGDVVLRPDGTKFKTSKWLVPLPKKEDEASKLGFDRASPPMSFSSNGTPFIWRVNFRGQMACFAASDALSPLAWFEPSKGLASGSAFVVPAVMYIADPEHQHQSVSSASQPQISPEPEPASKDGPVPAPALVAEHNHETTTTVPEETPRPSMSSVDTDNASFVTSATSLTEDGHEDGDEDGERTPLVHETPLPATSVSSLIQEQVETTIPDATRLGERTSTPQAASPSTTIKTTPSIVAPFLTSDSEPESEPEDSYDPSTPEADIQDVSGVHAVFRVLEVDDYNPPPSTDAAVGLSSPASPSSPGAFASVSSSNGGAVGKGRGKRRDSASQPSTITWRTASTPASPISPSAPFVSATPVTSTTPSPSTANTNTNTTSSNTSSTSTSTVTPPSSSSASAHPPTPTIPDIADLLLAWSLFAERARAKMKAAQAYQYQGMQMRPV